MMMDLVKARLGWVELYAQCGDAGFVCRRCGISRPTLRKWWRRYQTTGAAGLTDKSRRPKRLAAQKIFAEQETLILSLRRDRRLGVKQLRNELIRHHDLTLSLDTIHRVLVRHGEQVLKRPRRRVKGTRRYNRPIPGDRIQMDVCKICPGVYQYTAIDDCSRYKVLGVYRRRTAKTRSTSLIVLSKKCPLVYSERRPTEGLNSLPRPSSSDCLIGASSFAQSHRGLLISMAKSSAPNALISKRFGRQPTPRGRELTTFSRSGSTTGTRIVPIPRWLAHHRSIASSH